MIGTSTSELIEELPPAWPFRSYAPGNYMCLCISCRQHFEGDKRAIQCVECAVRDTKAHIASLEAENARLVKERDEAQGIVRDIHWMAGRYADGRSTYAPGMFNDAIRKAYTAGWLKHQNSPDPQYARDGMSPEYISVDARATAAESTIATITAKREALREALAKQSGALQGAKVKLARYMEIHGPRGALPGTYMGGLAAEYEACSNSIDSALDAARTLLGGGNG